MLQKNDLGEDDLSFVPVHPELVPTGSVLTKVLRQLRCEIKGSFESRYSLPTRVTYPNAELIEIVITICGENAKRKFGSNHEISK